MKKFLAAFCLISILFVCLFSSCKRVNSAKEKANELFGKRELVRNRERSGSFFDGNVRLIIPYEFGSDYDLAARKFASMANRICRKRNLECNIYCEQVAGGDGALASSVFSSSDVDSNELIVSSYDLWHRAARFEGSFDMSALGIQPLCTINDRSYILFVDPNVYRSAQEFIADSRRRELRIVGGDMSSPAGICAGVYVLSNEGKFRTINANGRDAAWQVMHGEADALVALAGEMAEYVYSGDLKPIAAFSEYDYMGYMERTGVPVPSIVSLGCPEAVIYSGAFLSVNSKLPSLYMNEIVNLIDEIVSSDEFQQWSMENSFNNYKCLTPDLEKHILQGQNNVRCSYRLLKII